MIWAKKTHPLDCGRSCRILDGNGQDLTEKYYILWTDDEADRIGVATSSGEPALRPATGPMPPLDSDGNIDPGPLVAVVDVPGLRFISGNAADWPDKDAGA